MHDRSVMCRNDTCLKSLGLMKIFRDVAMLGLNWKADRFGCCGLGHSPSQSINRRASKRRHAKRRKYAPKFDLATAGRAVVLTLFMTYSTVVPQFAYSNPLGGQVVGGLLQGPRCPLRHSSSMRGNPSPSRSARRSIERAAERASRTL